MGSEYSADVVRVGSENCADHIATGERPIHYQQRHGDWREVLTNKVGKKRCSEWRSLPRRFARLIEWSTKTNQLERWDMAQIVGELSRLGAALESPERVLSAELLAEEVVSNSVMMDAYEWRRDSYSASMALTTGVTATVQGDEDGRRVRLVLEYAGTGMTLRRDVGKWLPKAFDQSAAVLRKAGWVIDAKNCTRDSGCLNAVAQFSEAPLDCGRLGNALDAALRHMSLEG